MLEFRRILAFSSRVHTYIMVLYLFFASLFAISFFFQVDAGLIAFISSIMAVLSWLVLFEGVWIILACTYQLFYSRVFAFAPVMLTLLRSALVLLVATLVDALEIITSGGIVI